LVVVISDMAECVDKDGEQLRNAEHTEFWVGIGLNVYGFCAGEVGNVKQLIGFGRTAVSFKSNNTKKNF